MIRINLHTVRRNVQGKVSLGVSDSKSVLASFKHATKAHKTYQQY